MRLPIILLLFASFAAFGQDTRLYVVTHVDAEPNFTADCKKLLREFASDCRKDAGVLRVEVLEETARPNHFTVVEVWQDQKTYEGHLAHGHTKEFKAKLLPMLGSPLDERFHSSVQ